MKYKLKDIIHSIGFRISLYVAGAVACIMIVALGIISHMAKTGLQQDAIEKAESSLRNIVGDISQIIEQAETATRNYDDMALQYIDETPEKLVNIPHFMVEKNDWLQGADLAVAKDVLGKDKLFSPYSYQEKNGSIRDMLIDYNYLEYDWFKLAYESGKDVWGDPFKSDGTHEIISIFSHPVKRAGSDTVEAVCCANVSLNRLKEMIDSLLPYPGCSAYMISQTGNYIIHPNKEYVLQRNIHDLSIFMGGLSNDMSDSVTNQLLYMRKGHIDLSVSNDTTKTFADGEYSVYFCPIEKTGWSLAVVCPHKAVFAGMEGMLLKLRTFFCICIAILLIIITQLIMHMLKPLHSFTKAVDNVAKGDYSSPLPVIKRKDELYKFRNAFATMQTSLVENIQKLTETAGEQARIENELNIAKEIQQNLLSKAFSPYIDWPNLELYALLESAREVGGDLYDFFIRDRKLFFCVGDVSGKGVPAALFMAITRGLFRVIALNEDSPSNILTMINHTLSADNPQNMFVTMICGCLNLDNGHLSLANAGHNPPIRIKSNGKADYISLLPGVPLGFFEDSRYKETELTLCKDETFLAYTDGVTEAENSKKELYGEERLLNCAAQYATLEAKEMIQHIRTSINDFTADTEQSDDLTMYAIKRTGDEVETEYMRYLDFKNNVEEVEKLYPLLTEIKEDLGLDEMLVEQLNLAIEEALVNVIKYAYPEGEEGLIKLTIECPAGKHSLRIILTDYGIAFDPTTAKKADINADALDRPIGGLGIFLVNQIMTSVEYTRRNQSNILLMTKDLN